MNSNYNYDENTVQDSRDAIEQKGYADGKKYGQDSYYSMLELNIKGENYIRGFLRGLQEEYERLQSQEQKEEEPPQMQ